jgi:hypothetical protein
MKWITREKVKVDRVACPWLIKKFIDPQAEFIFVPADQVAANARELGATAFDIEGCELGHHGQDVSFNSIPRVGEAELFNFVVRGIDLCMFNLLKVREDLPADGSDPGWYKSPPGTLAEAAPEEDLKRDGIELPKELPKTASRLTPKDEAWCGVPPAKSPLLAKNGITARIKL